MPEYTLTAKYNGKTRRAKVWGDHRNMDAAIVPLFVHEGATEQEIADADASMSAMPIVLNRAADKSNAATAEIWSMGRIELRASDGRVVRVMEGK